MVSTYSPNKNLELPGNGDYVDTWNVPANADFTFIVNASASTEIYTLSSSNVTVTTSESQNLQLYLQGTLTASVNILLPAVSGMWIVSNQTSGSFTVTVKTVTGGSTGVAVTQGVRSFIVSNGTNVYFADDRVTPYSSPQDLSTTSSTVRFNSIGIGTAASGTTGEIRATGNITAYYSDARLKTDIKEIQNALGKVKQIRGVHYVANELAGALGYADTSPQVGVLAQEVDAVLPEAVTAAPFDLDWDDNSLSGQDYLTVRYERMIPLLIEAIKELSKEVDTLKTRLNDGNPS
jgi:hypothetical protein